MNKKKPTNTSWGGVAEWYGEYLAGDDTYQSKVILPNLLRVLDIKKGDRVLDLACGQGFFAREVAKAGAQVVGADLSPELIAAAKVAGPDATFHIAPATALTFAKAGEFAAVYCVLSLQNIEDIAQTFTEVRRVLAPEGRFIMVLNHPCFRVLKNSSWGYDEERQAQYRRIDSYLSGGKWEIEMHPGRAVGEKTISYHRSLQDFFKPLTKASFAVTRLEEWISHRQSERGPRQKAEDEARKEIPLFLMLEARGQ